MNYYEKHLGDYIKDTVGLSMLEDGAYNRLIDQYYAREAPLPADEIYRLARANTPEERAAVDYILKTFFELTERGYEQKRIEAEIGRFQDKQRKARASASARWAKSNQSTEGTAKAPASEGIPQSDHDGSGMRSDMRTRNEGNALQSPVTNTSSPGGEEDNRGSRRSSSKVAKIWITSEQMREGNDDLSEPVAEEYLSYRRNKRAPLTKRAWDSILAEVRKTGRPLEAALAYAMNRGWTGFEYAWVVEDVQRRRTSGGGAQQSRAAMQDEIARGLLDVGDESAQGGNNGATGDFIDVSSRIVD